MTDFPSPDEPAGVDVEGSPGLAVRACVVLGLAALTAATAARVVTPDALYDRWLILAAIGAGVAWAASSERSRVVSRSGTIAALALKAMRSMALGSTRSTRNDSTRRRPRLGTS